jgi:hypothetical protein
MIETRSPKRQARKRHVRLKHRRSLAAGQRIPPALAVGFTLGERAARTSSPTNAGRTGAAP